MTATYIDCLCACSKGLDLVPPVNKIALVKDPKLDNCALTSVLLVLGGTIEYWFRC